MTVPGPPSLSWVRMMEEKLADAMIRIETLEHRAMGEAFPVSHDGPLAAPAGLVTRWVLASGATIRFRVTGDGFTVSSEDHADGPNVSSIDGSVTVEWGRP